jgi:uncharacterized protein YebE (UPF0316 family)
VFWTTLGRALLIFALRVTDVSMGTVRTTMIVRGHRTWAALIGFVEVTIWVLAIGQVLNNLDSVINILFYSGGFAAGTLLGMWIGDRLALGHADLHVVSMKKGPEIADHLRRAGFGATLLHARGQSGPVSIINTTAPQKNVAEVIRLVNEIDATAFVTVDEARNVVRGFQRIAK